jgi:hypothetical protein
LLQQRKKLYHAAKQYPGVETEWNGWNLLTLTICHHSLLRLVAHTSCVVFPVLV